MGIIKERIKFLRQFDEYIRNNVEDEKIFHHWITHGLEDGATSDGFLLEEIARDNELWTDVVWTFATCCKLAGLMPE